MPATSPVKSPDTRDLDAARGPVPARVGFPARPAPQGRQGRASEEPAARPVTAGERAFRRVLGVAPGPVEAGLRMLSAAALTWPVRWDAGRSNR